ncbi:EPIDERMAL PATTERNING FACTOR-like protein 6 [Alnus glutinosa]|uniref:EPIDERMAL PATTERNING FACTOR-like protein 6 n=1 Tax=Alnus glutinosa TaxID=3517 RepID=UPI002D77DC8E|nr:EPIDERMAL PATTERNING FACTOR-like protein 6 [Alnus glutinosa]
MEWQRRRPRSINNPYPPILYCLSIFFFSFCALFSSISSSRPTCQGSTCPLSAKADVHFQEFEKRREEESMVSIGRKETSMSLAMRILSGPGSSPPRCTSKCGKCTPCNPVHVPVPPGTPVTTEYYPEAWRCKCGNKLYMP